MVNDVGPLAPLPYRRMSRFSGVFRAGEWFGRVGAWIMPVDNPVGVWVVAWAFDGSFRRVQDEAMIIGILIGVLLLAFFDDINNAYKGN
jgi:hypothetical protein